MHVRNGFIYLLLNFVVATALMGADWTPANDMNITRSAHTATGLPDGKVLVAGGDDGGFGAMTATAEIYDPTAGDWTTTGSMNTPRAYHTATLLADGTVLVAGGLVLDENLIAVATDSAERYDPATGSWSAVGALTKARSDHRSVLLPDGQVLVIGGEDAPESAERYDPSTQRWTTTADMNTLRNGRHTATLLNSGLVLVTGGNDTSFSVTTASAELYDPLTDQWTTTASMNSPRQEHTATRLPDGTVLVTGGANLVHLNTAEIYTPESGIWTNVSSLLQGRFGHSATLLQDGNVLMAYGYTDGENPDQGMAELYDAETKRWLSAGGVGRTRNRHTATLLHNGAVLVAGGNDASALTSSQLYRVNDTPVAVDDLALTTVNTPIAIEVLSNDSDEVGALDPATIAVSGGPARGSVTILSGSGIVSYTPSADFFGLDTFQYSVRDTSGALSNSAQVTVTVNDIPVAIDDQITVQVDNAASISVTHNDIDVVGGIDPTLLQIVRQPHHGTAILDAQSGNIRYMPDAGFFGIDTLQYIMQDTFGKVSNRGNVTILVGSLVYLPVVQN